MSATIYSTEAGASTPSNSTSKKRGLPARVLHSLTPREREVLKILAQGLYYKEISLALGISPSTVRAHLHSVYKKLNVKSRARAVLKFQGSHRVP